MQKKVRIGVVGCGVVAAAYYLPALMKMENAELVAVCDRFEPRTGRDEHRLDQADAPGFKR